MSQNCLPYLVDLAEFTTMKRSTISWTPCSETAKPHMAERGNNSTISIMYGLKKGWNILNEQTSQSIPIPPVESSGESGAARQTVPSAQRLTASLPDEP